MVLIASELPADILRLIFELLAQPDVLSTAAVSRAWRSGAVLDVNYYCACSYLLPHYGLRVDQPHRGRDNNIAQHLTEIVDDAAAHQYQLSLSLGQRINGELVFRSAAYAEPGREDGVAWFRTDVAPVLRRAVSLLVRLDLFLEAAVASVLLAVMTLPAPHLRSVAICVTTAGQPQLPSDL